MLEVETLSYSDDELIAAINEEITELSSYTNGVIGRLQKNPFLRLVYAQLEAYRDILCGRIILKRKFRQK